MAMLAVSILLPLSWYGMKAYMQGKTKELYKKAQHNYSIKYAYVLTERALDQVIYGDNDYEALQLLDYYQKLNEFNLKVSNGSAKRTKVYNIITEDSGYVDPLPIPVPLKYISVEKPVYIDEANSTKEIAIGYMFNTKCWGYIEVYVPRMLLQDTLPPESYLERFKEHLERLPESNKNYGKPSSYGFYCN